MNNISEIINACEKLGWRWHTLPTELECSNRILMPPPEDIRHGWCASFIPVEPGSNDRYPHWIEPNIRLANNIVVINMYEGENE